jgi:Flp pilus assembly protein TadG
MRASTDPARHGRGDDTAKPSARRTPTPTAVVEVVDSTNLADEGSVTAFTVIAVFALLLFLGVTVDCGQALTEKVQALGQAEDAARAGAQALDIGALRDQGSIVLEQGNAVRAADAYLAQQGVDGSADATPQQVSVSVTRSFPTRLLTLVGIDSLTVHATGTARAMTQAAP